MSRRREPTFTEQLVMETAEELAATLEDLAVRVERARRPAWARRHETLGYAVLAGILRDVQKGAALLATLDPAPIRKANGGGRAHGEATDGRPGEAVARLLARSGVPVRAPVLDLPVVPVRQGAAGG